MKKIDVKQVAKFMRQIQYEEGLEKTPVTTCKTVTNSFIEHTCHGIVKYTVTKPLNYFDSSVSIKQV